MTSVLGIFAKYWQPGQVKTRLARHVGAKAASTLYRAMVISLLRRLHPSADEHWLAYTPAEARESFAVLDCANWRLVPQSPGDLGTRIRNFFDAAFQGGATRVVLIGSDSPTLPIAHVQEAFESLAEHDLVIGPSEDGGYYLVGASHRTPPIFSDIDWSTERVWSQTTERAGLARLRWKELPTWYDIDEWNDLERLVRELRAGGPFGNQAQFADLLCAAERALRNA